MEARLIWYKYTWLCSRIWLILVYFCWKKEGREGMKYGAVFGSVQENEGPLHFSVSARVELLEEEGAGNSMEFGY